MWLVWIMLLAVPLSIMAQLAVKEDWGLGTAVCWFLLLGLVAILL